MDTSTQTVQCHICGHRMRVPPGYDQNAGRCSRCGAPLAALPDLDTPPSRPVTSAAPPPKPPARSLPSRVARGLGIGALWGIMGGFAVGTASAVVFAIGSALLAGDASSGALFGLDLGILLGGFFAATWKSTRELDLQAVGGAAVGALFGACAACFHHAFERAFLNLPEVTLAFALPVGLLGGLVLGGLIGFFNED